MDDRRRNYGVTQLLSALGSGRSEAGEAKLGRKARSTTPYLLVIAATLGLVLIVDLAAKAPAFIGYKDGLGVAVRHELEPRTIDPSWVRSGSPIFQGTVFERSDPWASTSGIWECTGPASFEWHYGVDESIYILEGSADIEYMGRKFTLHEGDSTEFVAGTTAVWTVEDHVKKTFRIHHPGAVIRAVRGVLDQLGV
jgi:uncharacterized protein